MNIPKTIRVLREFHGLTSAAATRRIGYSPNHMSSLETGGVKASMKTLERLAKAYEMPLSAVIFLAECIDDPPVRGVGPDDAYFAQDQRVVGILMFLSTAARE